VLFNTIIMVLLILIIININLIFAIIYDYYRKMFLSFHQSMDFILKKLEG